MPDGLAGDLADGALEQAEGGRRGLGVERRGDLFAPAEIGVFELEAEPHVLAVASIPALVDVTGEGEVVVALDDVDLHPPRHSHFREESGGGLDLGEDRGAPANRQLILVGGIVDVVVVAGLVVEDVVSALFGRMERKISKMVALVAERSFRSWRSGITTQCGWWSFVTTPPETNAVRS